MESQPKKKRVEADHGIMVRETIDVPPIDQDTGMGALILAPPRFKRMRDGEEVLVDGDIVARIGSSRAEIIDAANLMFHRTGYGSELVFDRRFRAHFGASPQVAAYTWD